MRKRPGTLPRTIAVTAIVTSMVWIGLGAWLFNRHIVAEHDQAGLVADAGLQQPEPRGAQPAGPDPADYPALGIPVERVRIAASGLAIPVAGVAQSDLVDTFADSRAAGARRHDAIDIMAPDGTPVLAAAEGTVEKLFVSDAGGKTIYVRTPDGRRIHYYAHLADYAAGLKEGETVARGQVLGIVGSSGNADPEAPHLHFAIMATEPQRSWSDSSAALNPYPLLGGR